MTDRMVLVLGCGVSGVVAARTARKALPSSYRVVVVDREAQASYSPAYLWVMMGERRPEAIRRNRGRLARHGVEFVNAEVRQLDLRNRYVRADSREFHYDYLILALGLDAEREGHVEAHNLESLDGAEHLAAALRYFSGGRILIATGADGFRYAPKPYEIAMLLEDYFHTRRVRQKVIISVCSPEASPTDVLGPANSDAVLSLLAHKGIEVQTERWIDGIDGHRRIAKMSSGEDVPFQMLITEPNLHTSPLLSEVGLADESGRIAVDPATFETAHENVFAVGDITYLPLLGGGNLPRSPGLAEKQGETAALNIAHRAGQGPRPAVFSGKARWIIETGTGAAMLAEGDFLSPQRLVTLKQPSKLWHLANLAQERYWLWHWY